MKLISVKKALGKAGAVFISEDSNRLIYKSPTHWIEATHNAGSDHVHSIHTQRLHEKSDSQTDYFPGTFWYAISHAIEAAGLGEKVTS